MDLTLFFDLIDMPSSKGKSPFRSSIYSDKDKTSDHEGLDMALIGLKEFRGSEQTGQNENSCNRIREQLYKLSKGYGDYGIVDLGNFRNGPRLEDTYLRLKEVCAYLMDKNIIPVLFGGSHDLDLGQFYAYESSEKLVSMLNVDNMLDLNGGSVAISDSHLMSIFKHSPNFLFSFHHLAYQSYLTDQKHLEMLDELSFESVRLGTLKANIREIEPYVRDADMLSFDMSAVQAFYAPGATDSKVYGLTGEEACQICWYAGQNEKLSSVGLYNYNADEDSSDAKHAFVMATMIWYFIEGYYHRKGENNFLSNDYIRYDVHLGGAPEVISFYRSKRSERWWMEVPTANGRGVFNRNRMVACSYSDYQTAQTGEVPDRWIASLDRISQ